jgi:hypothetical protein
VKGELPVALTDAVPSLPPWQVTLVELDVAETEQVDGMEMEHGVPSVRLPFVALKLVVVVAVFTKAVNPDVVTQVKPTDCPATKFVLVMVSRNLPTETVAPG